MQPNRDYTPSQYTGGRKEKKERKKNGETKYTGRVKTTICYSPVLFAPRARRTGSAVRRRRRLILIMSWTLKIYGITRGWKCHCAVLSSSYTWISDETPTPNHHHLWKPRGWRPRRRAHWQTSWGGGSAVLCNGLVCSRTFAWLAKPIFTYPKRCRNHEKRT